MKGLITIKSCVALLFGGLAFASCSHDLSDVSSNLEEYQAQVYNEVFKEEFGTPAANHNWGFGAFEVVAATEPMSSFDFMNANSAPMNRAVAEKVTSVKSQHYDTFDDVLAAGQAKCYFYLRIDNKIVEKEKEAVQNNKTALYFPYIDDLGNGVVDLYYSTDNEGLIDANKFNEMANVRIDGVSVATTDEPIPDDLFIKAPTFETMALHVPDSIKELVAGSVENFENNYKLFWYVAKWQEHDTRIHVDGVVVPKEQITVNVPEYRKRIIVEDLKGNINATTKVNSSDFDFNDVVFDAVTWKDVDKKNHLKIILRAAGGQMPIYVAGKEVHEDVGYMFNTVNPDYNFSKVLVQDSIIANDASTFDFNSIPVEVVVNGKTIAAGSNIGQAPEKIAVDLDYKWCKERMNIKDVYPAFLEYVADKANTNWWKPVVVD